jgi:hypothetical protein
VIEVGRIVAHLCRTYGWTPEYCLDRLSWAQLLMFDAYATEMMYRPNPAPATPHSAAQAPADAPDAAAIEQVFGTRIQRGDVSGR